MVFVTAVLNKLVFLFFLISLHPPRSTLFPYTTLFRSKHCPGELRLHANGGTHIFLERIGAKDRKSTRLNSSHRCISYAVFCLKKKTALTAKSNKKEVRKQPYLALPAKHSLRHHHDQAS